MASKLEKWANDLVEKVQNGEVPINDAIDQMDARLEVYDRVKETRNRLTSARRALLGVGSRTTSSGGSRVTQDEVAKVMSTDHFKEFGITVAELVTHLSGSNESQIRGHLNRGKDERFLKRSDGRWFLRDPEAGVNDEADLPEVD